MNAKEALEKLRSRYCLRPMTYFERHNTYLKLLDVLQSELSKRDALIDEIRGFINFHDFKRRSAEEIGYYSAVKHVEQILSKHQG